MVNIQTLFGNKSNHKPYMEVNTVVISVEPELLYDNFNIINQLIN